MENRCHSFWNFKTRKYLYFQLLSLLICLISVKESKGQQINTPKYLNSSSPINERLDDLLSRMTIEEKIAQMCQYVGLEHIKANEKHSDQKNASNNDATAFYPGLSIHQIEMMIKNGMIGSFLHVTTLKESNYLQSLALQSRLKIPLLIGIDAIHGNGFVKGCTIYPTQLGLASTWDTTLVRKIADYTAIEMRATGSQWAFSPNVDVGRDPRWGRIGETFGEDPFLVSQMGKAMINGLQGSNLIGSDHVLSCAKHLIAGGEPINGLNGAPSDMSERTLREIFLPPFRAAVEAGVYTVMPAHNEINGIPSHSNYYLMETLLRKTWGFKGFYVSDWMDIEHLYSAHHIASSPKEAVEKTINAGMDMHMHGPGFMEPILVLLKEGKISEERITASARKVLEAKFRLGLFEQSEVSETASLNKIFTKDHQYTALEAARKSIVLLKNEHILPLTGKYRKILVTGPNANNQTILGDWSFQQPSENVITVYQGIKNEAPSGLQVNYCDVGSSILKLSENQITNAIEQGKQSDAIIVVVGENSLRYDPDKTSGENTDRDDIKLAGLQQKLIDELRTTGKPVIVVLVNSRPLDISSIKRQIPAIIEAWEPGSFGGKAIAEILFGKVNPSGKLTVTFPNSTGQIHSFYNHKPSQFTRKFLLNQTGNLYEFGEGMSYTAYHYSNLKLSKDTIHLGESVYATFTITNTGKVAGDEIAQLYITGSVSDVTKPVKELKGFQRISLNPGESKSISFTITPEMLSCYDLNMHFKEEPGVFKILAGSSSKDLDLIQSKLILK